ncbi:hypothetical protein D3C85_1724450 [compost metagenome]
MFDFALRQGRSGAFQCLQCGVGLAARLAEIRWQRALPVQIAVAQAALGLQRVYQRRGQRRNRYQMLGLLHVAEEAVALQ